MSSPIAKYFSDFGILRTASKEFWLINALTFFDGLAYFSMMNVLALYLTNNCGFSDVSAGKWIGYYTLAISVITSHATTTPTLIFDEVDSGIGGAVAEVVGRLLKRLGQGRQVLCVTHLPQVASQANQHFQVAKSTLDNGKTASRIDMLDAKARVEEVARMLGGLEITATTRKHARELLAI